MLSRSFRLVQALGSAPAGRKPLRHWWSELHRLLSTIIRVQVDRDWREGTPPPFRTLAMMESRSMAERASLAPRRYIDYILAHELVHLCKPRHNKRFWMALARVMPDFADRKEWLAENGGRF